MANFLNEVKQLFEHAKAAPARDRAYISIPKKDGLAFIERQHYFQILINEMYLAKEREWWVRYSPVALVATTLLYGTEYQTAPIVVGPALFRQFSQDVSSGTIIRNAPVTGLNPYSGGAVTITILFNKVEKQDNSEKVLDVLETFSTIADPLAPAIPFSTYLKIAGSVMSGVRILFNLPRTQPILAYRETFNPQIQHTLAPGYLALMDVPGLTEAEKRKFYVKNDQLCYGETESTATPYRASDFILLEIAQASRRTDEATLPFFSLWQETRKLGLQSARQEYFWQEAKNHFNTLKIAINESPDLTTPDIKRLTGNYFDELVDIRQGRAGEQSLSPGNVEPSTIEQYQKIARQLDELDEL
jgi:hypothetical protein